MKLQKLVDLALKQGATEAEVYYSKGRVVTVETQEGNVGFAEESISDGIGIRVIAGGAIGYSSSNDPLKYEEAVKAAIACAKARGKDPSLKGGFPEKKPYKPVKGIYDERIEKLGLGECLDIADGMIAEARKDKGASVTFGKFSSNVSETIILNSNGIDAHEKETAAYGYIDVIIKEGGQVSTAYDFDVSRAFDIDFSRIGRSAADLARNSMNAVSIESKTCDVLLGPYAFSDLVEATLLFAITAESVQKGRSSLAHKLGKQIASTDLTMIDDGLLDKGLDTSAFDDEGTPCRQTTVIGDGVLNAFLYDCYTASKDGKESTGNAVRGSYTMSPKVGPHNVRLVYPRSDVLGETKKGVYVNSLIGAHTANPITGDFSVECRNSFVVEDGQKTKPIKSMMLGGNIFEFLNKLDGMGRDDRMVGAVISPTVKVRDVRVTHGS
jgi:PmbA protein